MEQSLPVNLPARESERARRPVAVSGPLGATFLILTLLALAVPVARVVWTSWTGDYRFTHGPAALAGVLYLLWQRRDDLRKHADDSAAGKWLLGSGFLLTAGLLWLDVPTLLPLAWLGLLLGATGSLWGTSALRTAAPALGLLLFALPWPTPILRGLTAGAQAITLHLTPLVAPVAGMQVERHGTLLTTTFAGRELPYSVIVGAGCAGMKYLFALGSLAYFAAAARRMSWRFAAAGVAAAIPLALLANSLRILLILGFGAAYGPRAGEWAHEQLGLVAFGLPCMALALGMRHRGVTHGANT